jgi:hypothetical protein
LLALNSQYGIVKVLAVIKCCLNIMQLRLCFHCYASPHLCARIVACPVSTVCATGFNTQQDRQSTYNVTMSRVHETIVAVESNKYYIFLCVCVCVCACVCVWGRYGCMSVGVCFRACRLIIQYVTRRRNIVCVL